MPERYFKLNKGASLIEIVLALALLTLVIGSVFGSQWAVGDLSLNNARIVSATNVANNELIKIINRQTNSALNPSNTQTSFGLTNSLQIKPFTRCQYVVDSNSVWQTGWRSVSTSSISILMSDLAVASKYAEDCGGQPTEFSGENLNLIHEIDLGYPAVSVDAFQSQAFVALRPTSSSMPDFAVVSLDSGHNLSFLDTGAGINKVDYAQGYVFAAHHSSSSQLQVIRANQNSGGIELVASSTLPGVAGARPEAVSIFYFDSKVYIGTKRTAGHELHVFDVSDPESPQWLGSREMNHNINEIVVKDGFAFLATSGNVRDLIVLDVHDPANMFSVTEVDVPGNEDGRSVHVVGNTIFLGRHKSLVPSHDELVVLSYEIDPNDGSLAISAHGSAPTGADVSGLTFSGGFVFAATSNTLKEIQIFKLENSNDLTPVAHKNIFANGMSIDPEADLFAVTAQNKLILFKQE